MGQIPQMFEVSSHDRDHRRRFLKSAALVLGSSQGLLASQATSQTQDTPRAPVTGASRSDALRVRIWCEGTAPKRVYPSDIDGAIADQLAKQGGYLVAKARLGDADSGLSDQDLDATDTLIWWGHLRHDDVPDDRVEAVVKRVRQGKIGLIVLHSSCVCKPFKALMGTSCEPSGWREDGRPEHIKINAPDHPIAKGVNPFTIPRSDMFAEPFEVPEPETLVLTSSWDQGETVRSGMTWTIEKGRVVYLRTGHEAYPVLFHPSVKQLLGNAASWAGRRV